MKRKATAEVTRPQSFGEALRREAKQAKHAKAIGKPAPPCAGCQQLVELLSQAIADNVQLRGQFETLRTTLTDLERARQRTRVWLS